MVGDSPRWGGSLTVSAEESEGFQVKCQRYSVAVVTVSAFLEAGRSQLTRFYDLRNSRKVR